MSNVNQSNLGLVNDNDNFIDKLISYRGFLKIFLFFSIQTAVLVLQLMRTTNLVDLSTDNFWDYNINIFTQIAINYVIFSLILLLIFAFNLGKEVKMRRKERWVLFSFKAFLFLIIFLIFNGIIIFDYLYLYYQAQLNYYAVITAGNYLWGPLLVILGVWAINFYGYFFIEIIKYFTKPKSKIPNSQTASDLSQQRQSLGAEISLQQAASVKTAEVEKINQTPSLASTSTVPLTTKATDTFTKQEIIQMQLTQQQQLQQRRKEQIQQQTIQDTKILSEANATPEESKLKETKPATPRFIFSFLEKNFFHLGKFDQALIFFVLSQFTWFVLFTSYLLTKAPSLAQININHQSVNILTNFSLLEAAFYIIVSIFYYDILKNDFKLSKESIRNNMTVFLSIGITIVLTSLILGTLANGDFILGFIIIKFFVLLLIPVFYFGYKNQNEPGSDDNKLTKINPVFRYFYNKSIDELRSNDKSADIIKKYLQTHKEDIKRSLLTATPVNFKENIRSVILKDYERLETLLKYNDISPKSKVAVIDYTMEIFSTFLINVEVNLQDVYTEHLLTANQENLLKPISPDFIESKFSKLFSQWESLDWSTQ